MAHMLELDRLENFRIKLLRNNVQQRRIHIYHATAKQNGDDQRFFIRALVRPKELKESDAKSIKDYLVAEGDRLLSEALDLLENRISASDKNKADCNHIFLNFVPRLSDHQWGDVRDVIPTFINRHGRRLWRLRVLSGEIRICIKLFSIGDPIPLRFFLENTLGDSIRVDIYQEVLCEDGRVLLKSIDRQLFGQAPLEDQQVMFPYAVRDRLQPKRFKAHLLGTTYVYDFPELFREALKDIWKNYALQMKQRGVKVKPPESLLQCTELYLDDRGELARAAGDREKGTSHSYINALSRITGLNTIGMVGWLMDIATPEYVGGRKIVVIANDITHQSGSFGLEEDKLFFCCSELARSLGVPRVYLSANSGKPHVDECFYNMNFTRCAYWPL